MLSQGWEVFILCPGLRERGGEVTMPGRERLRDASTSTSAAPSGSLGAPSRL